MCVYFPPQWLQFRFKLWGQSFFRHAPIGKASRKNFQGISAGGFIETWIHDFLDGSSHYEGDHQIFGEEEEGGLERSGDEKLFISNLSGTIFFFFSHFV